VEYLLLYLACSIATTALIHGCAYPPPRCFALAYLDRAAREAADGDFENALMDNAKALQRYPDLVGDRALYQRGLFYAHPKNPIQDYAKAIGAFSRLRKEYPSSPLYSEAEVWIVTLEAIGRKTQAVEALIKQSEDQRQSVDNLKKRITTQKERIASQRKQIGQLENQLEKMKNVDLGIERKKRKADTQ
jgi:tetratricopeptide (TPR) repeat protein